MDIITALTISARALLKDADRVRLVAAQIAAEHPGSEDLGAPAAVPVVISIPEQAGNDAILRRSRAHITSTLDLLRPPRP